MGLPSADRDRFELIRCRPHTPGVGDIVDLLGRYHQFLPPGIRPLTPDMIVVGRAMPVLVADVFGPQRAPFGKLTEALDQLEPGEVYLGRSGRLACAGWGDCSPRRRWPADRPGR